MVPSVPAICPFLAVWKSRWASAASSGAGARLAKRVLVNVTVVPRGLVRAPARCWMSNYRSLDNS